MRNLLGLAYLAGYVLSQQIPFIQKINVDGSKSHDYQTIAHGHGWNATTMSLSSLNSDFTTITHPSHPHHSVRIRKTPSDWCDDTAAAYTGYIDTIGSRHIFFYFFESRSDPSKDDVIMWTNGGPGCSSSLGLFMELGPCRVRDGNKTERHEHSWNEKANVFFIDQPIGVGFSYADYGEFVSTTEEAAQDIAAFVAIFFETFSQFKGRAFHMAGESYGGRYIPVYASAVYEQNKALVASDREPINLKSVMIGNGITDFMTMMPSYYDMTCTPASVKPIVDIASCVRMKTFLPRCEKWLRESCVDTFDAISCAAAVNSCQSEISAPLFTTGMNPYDISVECDGPLPETLCYPITKNISAYLDKPETRELLGVSPSLDNITFASCNREVGLAFGYALDEFRVTTRFHLEGLLDRGVDVLIYVGTYDWICNWVGNLRMADSLEWARGSEFNKMELRDWRVEEGGGIAGRVKNVGGLTYLTIEGAGHMVPYNKPVESLEMVKRWLGGKAF